MFGVDGCDLKDQRPKGQSGRIQRAQAAPAPAVEGSKGQTLPLKEAGTAQPRFHSPPTPRVALAPRFLKRPESRALRYVLRKGSAPIVGRNNSELGGGVNRICWEISGPWGAYLWRCHQSVTTPGVGGPQPAPKPPLRQSLAKRFHGAFTAIAQLLHGSAKALARLFHGSTQALSSLCSNSLRGN